MANNALQQFQKVWQGPAIAMNIDGKRSTIGQGEPKTTIIVKDASILPRLLREPSLTFGEAYMRGDVTIEGDILQVLEGFYRTGKNISQQTAVKALKGVSALFPSKIGKDQAKRNASHHYDVGNDFYQLWLDKTLTYTCAYFTSDDDTIEQAQRQKLELVARKIHLKPGMSVIDIGCGWGSFLFHIVENYDVHATGVVAAKEQGKHIQAEAKRRGLADKISVVIDDWRTATGTYDRVVSIGIMEHVGEHQYNQFLNLYAKLLKEGGLAFIHTIGRMKSIPADKWIDKYIFPGGFIPALQQITDAAAQAGFMIVDVENLRQHYARTLVHWSTGFTAHRDEIVKMYDEEFARMWWLYLQGSEAAFRWGPMELWQVVLATPESNWPLNREVNTEHLLDRSSR